MSDENAFIARLKRLTKPCRELDVELCPYETAIFRGEFLYRLPGHDGRAWDYLLPYTGSIDAAFTLVPSHDGQGRGLWINLQQMHGSHGSGKTDWSAEFYVVECDSADPLKTKQAKYWGIHPLPAVAILIAVKRLAAGIDV